MKFNLFISINFINTNKYCSMNFNFLDKNVSITTNVFLIIANIINLFYNIPQVIKTYKCKSTRDFSFWFLFLRVIGNMIWLVYAIEIDSFQMLLNCIITVLSSIFICFYKIKEITIYYKKEKEIEKVNLIEKEIEEVNLIEKEIEEVNLIEKEIKEFEEINLIEK